MEGLLAEQQRPILPLHLGQLALHQRNGVYQLISLQNLRHPRLPMCIYPSAKGSAFTATFLWLPLVASFTLLPSRTPCRSACLAALALLLRQTSGL